MRPRSVAPKVLGSPRNIENSWRLPGYAGSTNGANVKPGAHGGVVDPPAWNGLRADAGDYAEACLLPGDPLRAKYIADTYLTGVRQVNGERGLLGYTGTYDGTRVSVQGTGMGSPGATIGL